MCCYSSLYRLIDKQDGVRLLWSLLKSPNPEVRILSKVTWYNIHVPLYMIIQHIQTCTCELNTMPCLIALECHLLPTCTYCIYIHTRAVGREIRSGEAPLN